MSELTLIDHGAQTARPLDQLTKVVRHRSHAGIAFMDDSSLRFEDERAAGPLDAGGPGNQRDLRGSLRA